MAERNGSQQPITQLELARIANSVLTEMVKNDATLLSRAALAESLLDKEGADLNCECGYVDTVTAEYCKELYRREGLATKVVNIYPDACWSVYPEVYETEGESITSFEQQWSDLIDAINPWHYLHRVDRLSGVGRYGILLLGLDDGLDLLEPVSGFSGDVNPDGTLQRTEGRPAKRNLLYMRVFDETLVQINEVDQRQGSPRYGQPILYTVRFSTPGDTIGVEHEQALVHWTRVVHVADNCESSETYGVPRMEPVANRMVDLRKILGGSAEMFWKGAQPGYQFVASEGAQVDAPSIREEFKKLFLRLQRYMAFEGGEARSLAPQVANPKDQFETQIRAVCSSLDVPIRIFMGSEAAHLASSQDKENWNSRVQRRQRTYLDPKVVRPFVNRLADLNILAKPAKFYISWKDLNSMSGKDIADVGLKNTQSLLQYVTSGIYQMIRPKKYLTVVLHFTADEADAIIQEAGGEDELIANLTELVKTNVPGPTNPTEPRGASKEDGQIQRNAQGGTDETS